MAETVSNSAGYCLRILNYFPLNHKRIMPYRGNSTNKGSQTMSEFQPMKSPSGERFRRLAAQTKSAATARAAMPVPKIAKGDAVNLVHMQLGHVDATVVKIKGGGRIDLETVDEDPVSNLPTRITNAPFDPSGMQPDSWHCKPEPNPSSPPPAPAA
jgi:hypothetical protein